MKTGINYLGHLLNDPARFSNLEEIMETLGKAKHKLALGYGLTNEERRILIHWGYLEGGENEIIKS